MHWITEDFIQENIQYPELIEALKIAFRENIIQSPPKQVYDYQGIPGADKNTFLFMPSWDNQSIFGTKLITVTPNNSQTNLPYIQGMYILFDAQNGRPLVAMDAKEITNIRTAATSALAASYLAKKDAQTLLIIGNGSLAPYFIKAHKSVRNYQQVFLWGRRQAPSQIIKNKLEQEGTSIKLTTDYQALATQSDVISCITSAKTPLLSISNLHPGQHVDLAGSFTPDMHEVDTDVILSCSVYTDNLDTTPYHAGELVKAVQQDSFNYEDIAGDLAYLCQDDSFKRKDNQQITLFKSTGMALEDLVIAQLIYQKHKISIA